MPNETIVQYILNVETGKAEAGLKETSQASKQVEQSFDQVGNSSTKMNQKLKQTEQQAKKTQRGFRNLRRAGRDLDGAFSDRGQGIGLVSPAAGNLFMTLSNGASVAEGLGRVVVGFMNPAMLGVVAVMATAGTVFAIWNASQEAAAERAKVLAKATKDVTEALEQQQKILNKSEASFGSLLISINAAETRLRMLRGEISKTEFAELMALQQAGKAGQATKDSIDATIRQLKQLNADTRKEVTELNKSLESIGKAEQAKPIFTEKLELEKVISDNEFIIKQLTEQRVKVDNQAAAYGRILSEIAEIDNKEKSRSKTTGGTNKKLIQQQAAARKLQGIINKLTLGELTGREKILEQYNQELQKIEELGKVSGDMFAAAEAELLLREKRDRLLDEELRKEKERLGTAQDMLSIVAATASAMRSPEAFVSSIGGILGQAGAVPSPTAQAISKGGQAAVAIAGFGGLIQQAIDEAAKQEIPVILDEKQAERVVLGNMNEAFSNFIRDLERGLGLLPETIVRVLPAFIVSIGKVLTVDLQRLIIIDLPLALLRATPELVIAIINEIGFILADLINGFRLALDQFTAFIQAVFTKEGRQDAIADSIDGLRRWFETRFTGVEAVRDAIGAFAGGGSFIPQAAGGMRYTGNQRSGLAMLHQGEFVVPQSGMRPQSVDRQMSSSGGSPINIVINSPVVEQNAVDALVRRIEERFNSNFGLSSSNLFGGR